MRLKYKKIIGVLTMIVLVFTIMSIVIEAEDNPDIKDGSGIVVEESYLGENYFLIEYLEGVKLLVSGVDTDVVFYMLYPINFQNEEFDDCMIDGLTVTFSGNIDLDVIESDELLYLGCKGILPINLTSIKSDVGNQGIIGFVFDEAGIPIAGAEVNATSETYSDDTLTDAIGRYALPLESGIYDITASKVGYISNLTEDIEVVVNEISNLDITLNKIPEADFNYDPGEPMAEAEVDFTDLSTDDGTIESWLWDFGDGNTNSEQNPTHIYDEAGSYDVTLTVIDNNGVSDEINKTIVVVENSQGIFGYVLDMDANKIDGADVTAIGDSSEISTISTNGVYRLFLEPDITYTVTASKDDYIGSSTDISVSVGESIEVDFSLNKIPVADFSFSPSDPKVNQDIEFTDSSSDEDGEIVSWSWDFGDGITSDEQNPTHSYGVGGDNYIVTLTVTDNDGASDSSSDTIYIDPSTTEDLDIDQSVYDGRGFSIRNAADGFWSCGQSFKPTVNTITRAEIYIQRMGTPEFDLTVELRKDSSDGELIDTLTFNPEEIDSSMSWLNLDFKDTLVSEDAEYLILVIPPLEEPSTSFGYGFGYANGDVYEDGSFWFTRDGGNLWIDLNQYECTFRVYGTY